MEYRKRTDDEIVRIVNYFLRDGDTYVKNCDSYLGYHSIANCYCIITEIYVDSNQLVNIEMFRCSFSDDGMTAQEIVGYLQCEMGQIMPGASVEKHIMEDNHISVDFYWY